jgi:hypothetical protein
MARVLPFNQYISQTGRDENYIFGNRDFMQKGQIDRINQAIRDGKTFAQFFREEKNYVPTQFDGTNLPLSNNFKFQANPMFGVYFFTQNGELQNYGDLPARLTNKHGFGSLEWYENGEHFRMGDKPTSIKFSVKGQRDIKLTNADWKQNKQVHRENNLPASISQKNNLFELSYYDNGIRSLKIIELGDGTYKVEEYNESSKYDPINTTIIDKSNSSWEVFNTRVNNAKREFANINLETQKYFDFFQQKIDEFSNSGSARVALPRGLNQPEMRGIFKMLKKLRKTVGEKYDFHEENFGIFQHSRPDKPVFVVFDI